MSRVLKLKGARFGYHCAGRTGLPMFEERFDEANYKINAAVDPRERFRDQYCMADGAHNGTYAAATCVLKVNPANKTIYR